jgi:UDP-N-acetylmuramoyl-L-alanyl-D-glutamate--2,6-diaminopimelate ligase
MPAILHTVPEALAWLAARRAASIATDSRRVREGDAFIAWPGGTLDGRQFVGTALAAGAVGCLVEAQGMEAFGFDANDARIAAMPNLKAATGPIASGFLGEPSRQLPVVAVTGTNGKTSTSWWTAQALTALGRRCGVVGTLGVGVPPLGEDPGTIEFTGLTTPDPVTLHAALRSFVEAGFAACAMEASSIGIEEHRLTGTQIAVAAFTNFTQDHLDYHGTMEAYGQAKARLFAWPGLAHAVINLDDPFGADLARRLERSAIELWSYSTRQAARLHAQGVRYEEGGLAFELCEGHEQASVRTGLIGDYNVSNLLAVAGSLRALGVPLHDVARSCARLTPVPGRMQRVGVEGHGATEKAPEVVVDYAHTPDALEKALLALQPLARTRGGRLWCVFGCGGNRDATKRPLMGAVAARLARHVIVTSDNPRMERPADILQQIVTGMTGEFKPMVIEDRRTAIGQAIRLADSCDVILIAGKGHEHYQEVGGVKHPFSDLAEAGARLAERLGIARRPT